MPVFESASNDAPLTAQAIEDIEAAAYEEGRQRGYADGLKTGREDMNQQVARLRGLIEQIARPLATLDDEVERALVDLACAVARRLLDEELTLAPERVLTLARSEEHTSELQSLMRISYAVFCLKKKKQTKKRNSQNN